KGEYVSGKVHVNGMEGFWGLSKTNMNTYKGIRKRNWEYYLKEMEFR
ncbi:IS1595 family transposase, partial [candidate division WOR-3 bacterium]|nr:IS1595 family transposase [candidate division WOR-3 bacterium]MBD3364819.1 IS1595 family transposase [candidate division WOR-3 bacterium]